MTNQRKFTVFVVALDAAVLLAALCLRSVAGFMINFFPDCFFKSALGIDCPSCGGTRCVYYFFSGDFARSFGMNQFFFIVIIYIILLFLALNLAVFKLDFARKAVRIIASWQAVVVFAFGYLLFGIIRIILQFS